MSALPPKADIAGRDLDVRFVPIGDIHFEVMPLVVAFISRAVWSVDVVGRSNWNRVPLLPSDDAVS
jgi:hypothetical protein